MNAKSYLNSIFVLVFFCSFVNPVHAVPAGWQVTKLTNNDYDDINPRACEGKVVWVANDGTDTEIMFYNGTSTIQLTNNSFDDTNPQISGNNIVWTGHDGEDWEIFYYNGSTTTQLTNNSYNDINPSICGNQITWQGVSTGLGSHVFYYDGLDVTQISTIFSDMQHYSPVIDGNDVAWIAGGRNSSGYYIRYIILYDEPDISVVEGPIYGYVKSLSFKGNRISWSRKLGQRSGVYSYNRLTDESTLLGDNTLYNTLPVSSPSVTVWQAIGENSKDIYWSIRSSDGPYRNLTKSSYSNIFPSVSDLRIVWIQQRDTGDYVYLRDGGRNMKLSMVSSEAVKPPHIDGTTITWAQRDANDFEVWIAIPRPIYVDDTAPGSENGLNWHNAYTKLQDALAAASPGDEIRVAQGIYYPDEGVGQLDNSPISSFEIVSGTSLKGSYAGYGSSNPDQRDPNLYETILSGDLQQNDVPITDINDLFYARSGNAHHVISSSVTNPETLIDGFTITGGRAGLSNVGGGLMCYGSSNVLTVSNCKFALNQGAAGGAMYQAYGQLIIENCTFENNLAITGGGVYTLYSEIQIADCNFTGNCAQLVYEPGGLTRNGGAVIIYDSNSSIRGCNFADNYAVQYSGAVHYDASSQITTDTYDCTFVGNRSGDWGGAILYLATGTGNIAKCSFINNSSGQGAGLAIYNSIRPYITNCEFIANFSTSSGGALWNGHNCSPKVFGCLFVGNSAVNSGGAILCTNYNNIESGWPKFSNCTFVDNSSPLGSLVACEKDSPASYGPSTVSFQNSIIRQSGDLVYIDDGSTVKFVYSNVQGGYSGSGNFDADPCFISLPNDGGDGFGDNPGTPGDESINDDYGNLRLSPGSVCIDRGCNGISHFDYADLDNDGYKGEPVPYDLDGSNRFTDDQSVLDMGLSIIGSNLGVIDLGCYERGSCGDDNHSYPDGDVNYDCYVNLIDFAIMAGNWLNCTDPGCQ